MASGSAGDGGEVAVAEVELVRVRLALVQPHRAAHGSEEVRDLVLIRVTLADGTVGWGECSALSRPSYSAEYTAGAWALLRDVLAPAVLAGGPLAIVGHPMARAGLDGALTDARLRGRGAGLAHHLAALHGDVPAPSVPVAAVVSRADQVDDVVAAAAGHVDAGAALVKVKVTPDAQDVAAIEAVRSTWPHLALAADANGSADDALLDRLDHLDLAYIEQPAPAEALVTSAAFAQRSDTPIALDESVTGAGSLRAAIALGAGSILNVKPARVGGVEVAARLVAEATEGGWSVFVGGLLETGVGRATAAAVAALPGCTLPTDLGPSHRYFERDLTDPLVLDDGGRLVIPTGAGMGRVPHPDRVDAAAVDRLVLTP